MGMPDVPVLSVEAVRQMCRHSGVDDVTEVLRRTGGEISGVFEVRSGLRAAEGFVVKVYSEQWAWKQDKEVHVLPAN